MKLSLEKYKTIVPPQEIDEAIAKGREKGKKKNRVKYKKSMWGIVASLLTFVILLNTSVAFAKAISDVPIIRDFANMILINPGIKYALKEGYIQEINKTCEIEGVKVTITRVVGDNKRLIFGYTIEGIEEKEGHYIGPRRIRFQDAEGKELKVFLSYGFGDYSNDGLKPLKNEKYFEIGLTEKTSLPEQITVVLDQIENKSNSDGIEVLSTFKFAIDIELKDKILKVEPEAYVINKEVDLDGLSVFIKEMRIYPMGTEIVIEKGLGKEQRFTWIDDGYLEDEKGNVFRLYQGHGTEDENEYVLTFGGGAYKKSKSLTLKGKGIFYQPKVDRELIIDRKNEKLLEDGDFGIELLSIDSRGDETQFSFKSKDGAKIKSIDLMFIEESKSYSQFWYSSEDEYMSEFGVSIDSASVKDDILRFAVTNIQKFETRSFAIELK